MSINWKHIGIAILCTATGAFTMNCSSSDGGSGGRALSTQEAALNTSITAMASLGVVATASYAPVDTMRASLSAAQATDTFCDDNGSSTIPYTGNEGIWAFSKFLCAGAHNTYSPDSALGALSLMKGIICTADQNGITYSASGSATTLTNATLTPTCFPTEMLAKFASESPAITAVSGTVTGFTMTSSGWDSRIEFRNMSPIDDFDIYVRSSDNVIAAAFVGTGGDDSWTVTIDRRATPNRLVYEAANSNRHMRLLAEGSISSAGIVNSVTGMAGIVAEAAGGEYVSLTGTEANGVRISFEKSGESEVTDSCFDVADNGATCGSTTQLSFHAGQVTGFTDSGALAAAAASFDNNPVLFILGSFPVGDAPGGSFTTLR